MRLLLCSALTTAALFAGPAHAACIARPVTPTAYSTVTNSPVFRWTATGDCASFRVQLASNDGTNELLAFTGAIRGRSYQLSEARWNLFEARDLADGVYFRVHATDSSGVTRVSQQQIFYLDPDLDDDGVSVGAGDCDDADPSAYPGAPEVCGDGSGPLDANCDGVEDPIASAGYASFSGAGDRLVGSDALLPSGDAARTVAAWVRTTSTAEQYAVAWGTWDWDQGYHLGSLGGASVFTDVGTHFTGGAVNDGAWHHLVETSEAGAHALYVDGVLTATGSISVSTVLNQLAVGSTNDGPLAGAKPWTGDIDEVAVWSRALDASEVAALTLDGPELSDGSLVAWYPFDDTCGAVGDGFSVRDVVTGASLSSEGDTSWPQIVLDAP